jgi:hypothetical protein
MASTKTQLDDAAKAASRQQTLRRYADKYVASHRRHASTQSTYRNKKKLRAAAQQRMQRCVRVGAVHRPSVDSFAMPASVRNRRVKHKRWQSAPRPPDIARSRHISAYGTKGLNKSCRNKVQLREADALRRPKYVAQKFNGIHIDYIYTGKSRPFKMSPCARLAGKPKHQGTTLSPLNAATSGGKSPSSPLTACGSRKSSRETLMERFPTAARL